MKKAWAMVFKKGNIWALAIGVLIGTAFGAVVNSLAKDIIMQAIAKWAGFDGVNYMSAGTTKWEQIDDGSGGKMNGLPLNGIMYGKFISAVISFFIIVVFLVLFTWAAMSIWSKIKKKKEEVPAVVKPTTDELILKELIKMNKSNSKPKTKKTTSKK